MTDSLLSENDLKLVQSILDNHRIRRVRRETGVQDLSGPEKYVMLPPSDGIPAVSVTSGEGAAPGSALCSVYRILNGLLSDTGKTRTVFNLSGTAITQQWIAPERDKYGSWIIDCACVIVELVTGDDTPFCGTTGGVSGLIKLLSGQFSSTIKTSLDVTSKSVQPSGISWDGTNTPWVGSTAGNDLVLQSGQFSSTIKDSEEAPPADCRGLSVDQRKDTPYLGDLTPNAKLGLISGQFVSTIKTSIDVDTIISGTVDGGMGGVSSRDDGSTLISVGVSPFADSKNYIIDSPQFSTTILASIAVGSLRNNSFARDLSWDGTNTVNATTDKFLVLYSGFTGTILDSEDVVSHVFNLEGCNSNKSTVG